MTENTLSLARLLQLYNKNTDTSNTIDTKSENVTKEPTLSLQHKYGNPFEILYNQMKTNKNFSNRMYEEALKEGTPDVYLSLLSENKNNTLSSQFYNDDYFDYYTNLTELMLQNADRTNEIDRKVTMIDNITGEEYEESLGKMSDYDWYNYQLVQSRERKAQELILEQERLHKENMSGWDKFWNTIDAGMLEFGEGILSAGAGLLDSLWVWASSGIEAAVEGEEWADKYVEWMGSKSLTALEKQNVRAALDEYERLNTFIKDIDGNATTLGSWYAGILNSWGMMVPAMLTNMVLPGAGTYTFYLSIYSNNLYENATIRQNALEQGHDSPAGIAIANAAIKSGAEALIEWGLGKMFGGPSVQDIMRGAKGTSIKNVVKSLTSKSAALKFLGKNMLQEGAEEFFQDLSSMLIDQFTGMIYEGYGEEGVNFRTLLDSFIVGALSSMFLTGMQIGKVRLQGASYNRTAGKVVTFDNDINSTQKNITELENQLSKATADNKADIESKLATERETLAKLEKKKANAETRLQNKENWANPVIEKEGELVELKGAKKLMFNEMISEFNQAVQDLQKKGITDSKSLELAQQIYGYAITMSSLFSSFDTTRLKNCLTLLDRVAKSETQKNYTTIDKVSDWLTTKISTDKTKVLAAEMRLQDKYDSAIVKQNRAIVDVILKEVAEMRGGAMLRHELATARKMVESNIKKVVGKVSKDGKLERVGSDNTNIFDDLTDNLKAENTLKDITKDKLYSEIFATDGTVAIEDGDILFVPVSWLRNYTKSDTYKFLTQQKLIDAILYNDTLQPFLKDLVEFNLQFTPFTSMSPQRALMNFMFNPSVAQGFMLKENGKYLHRYSEFIFNLQNIIKLEGSKLNAENKAYLEQAVERIKNNLRIPTIKAIINWNIDPQVVHADTILSRADREFVKREQVRKSLDGRVLSGENSSQVSRYIAQKENILNVIEKQGATEIAEYIREHINDNETSDTYKNAFILLQHYDKITPKTRDEINNIPLIYNIYNNDKLLGIDDKTDASDIQIVNDKIKEFANEYRLDALFDEINNSTLNLKKYLNNINLVNAVIELYDITLNELTSDIFVDGVVRLLENRLEDRFSVQYKDSTLKIAKAVNNRVIFNNRLFSNKDSIINYVIKNGTYNENTKEYSISVNSLYNNDAFSRMLALGLLNDIKSELLSTMIIVKSAPDDSLLNGYYRNVDGKSRIVIYTNSTDSRVTFLHEYNHMLQEVTGLYKGGNSTFVSMDNNYLTQIAKTYKDAIKLLTDYDIDEMRELGILNKDYTINENFVMDSDFDLGLAEEYSLFINKYTNNLSEIGYMMLEGEIYSQSSKNRPEKGGQIKGHTTIGDLIIPQIHLMRKSDKVKLSKEGKAMIANNAIVQSFINALDAREKGLDTGKYHSKLSNEQSLTLTEMISNKNLSSVRRTGLTIDKLIKHPNLLSEDIRSKIDTSSEGKIFAGLKKYYEDITGNISIDIDANTHRYVFVDNDTFSDMYVKNVSNKNLSKEQELTLSDIYSKKELSKLGIPEDIKVIISKDSLTETRFDKKNPNGIITIQLDSKDSNTDILHKINHEFRHILQKYNDFEGGFTPDFKVTEKMRKEFKEELPELFEIETTLSEDELIQYFTYLLSTGELNAYGIMSDIIMTRPIYETYEAGKPTIYMPWYDPKTNKGRYETDFLAGRMADLKGTISTGGSKVKPVITDKNIVNDIKQGIEDKSVTNEIAKSEKIDTRRKVAKSDFENGNNLKYFWKEREGGKLLTPDIMSLVKATTGRETSLPADFMKLIYNGSLNQQMLYEYIKSYELTDNLLNLVNDHVFKNDAITNVEFLKEIGAKVPMIWASARVLDYYVNLIRKSGQEIDVKKALNKIGVGNDINLLLAKIKVAPELENKYSKELQNYFTQRIDGKATDISSEKIHTGKWNVSYDLDTFVQLIFLKYYDGTIESAINAARSIRASLVDSYMLEQNRSTSGDATSSRRADDKDMSLFDRISSDDANSAIYVAPEYLRERGHISEFFNDELATREQMEKKIWDVKLSTLMMRYTQIIEESHNKKLTVKQRENLSNFIEYYANELLANEILLSSEQNRVETEEFDSLNTKDWELDIPVENSKIKEYKQNILNAKKVLNEIAKNLSFLNTSELQAIMNKVKDTHRKMFVLMSKMNENSIVANYNRALEEELTGQYLDNPYTLPYTRKNAPNTYLLTTIKNASDRLLRYIYDGKVDFDLLPKDVQEMYTRSTFYDRKTLERKIDALTKQIEKMQDDTIKQYNKITLDELKERLSRITETGKQTGKPVLKDEYRNPLLPDRDGKRQLVDNKRAAEIGMRLKEVADIAKTLAYQSKSHKDAFEKAERKRQKEMQKTLRIFSDTIASTKEAKTKEIKVKEKYTRTDIPNTFVITSGTDMPKVLQDIFDTSFNRFADDKVQGVSKDESGKYYEKGDKDFKGRLEHEITSWKAFYEANRDKLMSLTRDDVLDIVRFVSSGSTTVNVVLAQKLAAFELFTLGYIVDVARSNANSWNFSDSEIAKIEELYTTLASTFGTGLNAVKQMIAVVNPYREVAQRQLDRFGITEDESKPLFDAMKAYDTARDSETRKDRLKEVLAQIDSTETLAVTKYWSELDEKKKYIKEYKKSTDIGKQALVKQYRKDLINLTWRRIKDIRYKAMLSSPMTGIRNRYSNTIQYGFIKASDAIANLVFRGIKKGGYKEGQIDLYNIKTSAEVKRFLDTELKSGDGKHKYSNIVDMFLDYSTKYDTIGAKGSSKKDAFIKLVENVIEKKVMAGTVWKNEKGGKILNYVDKYIQKNITDKPFVRKAAIDYMGKLLTLYVEQGKIDITSGINYSIMEVFAESVIMANEDYVRKYSPLSDYIAKLQEKHHLAYEVLSFWQPFINSGLNWFIEMTKYTPIGLGTAITRMIKLENNIAKIDADRAKGKTRHMSSVEQFLIRRDIGKGIVGSVLWIVGALLGGLGVIKISDDDDKFYINIGDEVKIDISNVFGTSSVLMGAALTQIFAKDEDGNAKYNFGNIIDMMSSTFFESFLLKDLIERHSFSDGFYEGMLTETESMLKSFIPQAVQLLVRLTNNKKIKYSPGFLGMLERYMNSFVPTQPFGEYRVNPYTGEPMTKYALPILGEVLKSGFLGPRIVWQEVTDEQILCESYGISKKELTGKYEINNEKVEFKNKKVLNEFYGKLNKETLNNLSKQSFKVQMSDGTYKTLSWDKMSDEQKANVINRLMSRNAEAAKVWYWTTQLGYKYYTSSSNIKALRDLGLDKNLFIGDKGFVK